MPKNLLKNLLAIVITLTLGFSSAIILSADGDSNIRVVVDGQEISFTDQTPVIVDGRTLVPIRDVFEAIGFVVDWDEETATVLLSYNDGFFNIAIEVGQPFFSAAVFSPYMPVGHGVIIPLDVPAQIIGDRTMLPLRALLEYAGYQLDWAEETRTITITAQLEHTMGTPPAAETVVNIRHLLRADLDDVRDLLGNQIDHRHIPSRYSYRFDSNIEVDVIASDGYERIIGITVIGDSMTGDYFPAWLYGENLDDVRDFLGTQVYYSYLPAHSSYQFDSGIYLVVKAYGVNERTIMQASIDYSVASNNFHFDQINSNSTFNDIVAVLGFATSTWSNTFAYFIISEAPYMSANFIFGEDGRIDGMWLSGFYHRLF